MAVLVQLWPDPTLSCFDKQHVMITQGHGRDYRLTHGDDGGGVGRPVQCILVVSEYSLMSIIESVDIVMAEGLVCLCGASLLCLTD